MRPVHVMILFAAFSATVALGRTPLPQIIGSPRQLNFGMPVSELVDQKAGLFPGPTVMSDVGGFSFKTFMEIEGMGSPGHRSYYYLFENNELHGVIKTTSLLGLNNVEATRVASLNYKRVLEIVSGQPETSKILRADGGSFSRVTLEKWDIDDPGMKVFHVSTNFESTVGVLYGSTHFPTDQLFVSSEDKRFQGHVSTEGTITDVSRTILQSAPNPQLDDRNRQIRDRGLANSQSGDSNHNHHNNEGITVDDVKGNSDTMSYLTWILIAVVILGILYVIWMGRKTSA